jgi:membrane protease YdiL (CAAX protease family)
MKVKGLYIAGISLMFTMVVVSIIAAIAQGDPEQVVLAWGFSDFGIFAVGLHSMGLCITLLLLRQLLKKLQWTFKDIGTTWNFNSRYFIHAAVAVLIAFVLYPLVEKFMDLCGIPMHWGGSKQSHFVLKSSIDVMCAVLGAAIIVPVLEEVIFRGYFLTAFVKHYTPGKAALFSVLLFTSIHIPFGPGMIIYIFIWSWLPAYLFMKSKSIIPGIAFHVTNNFLAYVILPVLGF